MTTQEENLQLNHLLSEFMDGTVGVLQKISAGQTNIIEEAELELAELLRVYSQDNTINQDINYLRKALNSILNQ